MLFILSLVSVIVISLYRQELLRSISRAKWMKRRDSKYINQKESTFSLIKDEKSYDFPLVSVIVPVYNEEQNIESCIRAVISSTQLSSSEIEIWIVDDQSADKTLTITRSLQQEFDDGILKILQGKPRPENEKWIGKNWACHQGAEVAKGEFLLFIDADVTLEPRVIETAIDEAQKNDIDLLSLVGAFACISWSEWLVQPIIFTHLQVVCDHRGANDPRSKVTAANGQFMLFRRASYEKLGGHRRVAGCVAEDGELGRLIKSENMKLLYLMAPEWFSARMYRSWAALWEGWTKNFYLAMQRQWWLVAYAVCVLLVIFPMPWLVLGGSLGKVVDSSFGQIDYLTIILASVAIFVQYDLRQIGERFGFASKHYWWFSGIGGFLFALILIASMIKVETGWGWTWRGRQLN
jgi:glycosyltransferase involved in cell wall biosynthesis